jgi:hypothetical protein
MNIGSKQAISLSYPFMLEDGSWDERLALSTQVFSSLSSQGEPMEPWRLKKKKKKLTLPLLVKTKGLHPASSNRIDSLPFLSPWD